MKKYRFTEFLFSDLNLEVDWPVLKRRVKTEKIKKNHDLKDAEFQIFLRMGFDVLNQ